MSENTNTPGQQLCPGNSKTTLKDFLDSNGMNVGRAEIDTEAAHFKDEEEILKGAIPASVLNKVLMPKPKDRDWVVDRLEQPKMEHTYIAVGRRRPQRGNVMKHIPSGIRVVILEPDIDTDEKNRIRHLVYSKKLGKKFKVPEDALEFVKETRHDNKA